MIMSAIYIYPVVIGKVVMRVRGSHDEATLGLRATFRERKKGFLPRDESNFLR